MPSPNKQFTLNQALDASPNMASLTQRIAASQRCLALVKRVVPPMLRDQLQAGPLDDQSWCILVPNPSVASKMRQLLPSIQATLRVHGFDLEQVVIKLYTPA